MELQISFLPKYGVTRLIAMVSAIAERMGVARDDTGKVNELKSDIAPERVLEKIEETKGRYRQRRES